jgi:hypothetical protein
MVGEGCLVGAIPFGIASASHSLLDIFLVDV